MTDKNEEAIENQEPQSLGQRRRAFGESLRQCREQAGMSVVALAQATRISLPFLNALESGDLERLPGRIFGRGFVKNICRALEVDPASYLDEYETCWEGPNSPIENNSRKSSLLKSSEGSTTIPQMIVGKNLTTQIVRGAAVIAVIGVALYYLNSQQLRPAPASIQEAQSEQVQQTATPALPEPVAVQPESAKPSVASPEEPTTAAEPATETSGAVEPAPEADENIEDLPIEDRFALEQKLAAEKKNALPAVTDVIASAQPQTLSQVLTVNVLKPVRIRVTQDGEQPVVKEYGVASHTIEFADQVDLLVYNAAAVDLQFNGKPLGDLGNDGRVRRLSFRAQKPTEMR